jgi:hypothetical protein
MLLSSGAAQQRAATTQTPRRPKGAGGGEERAGQARATMHAPFERQVEPQNDARRGIIFFAATEVRILPARHVEQAPLSFCVNLRARNTRPNPCRSCTLVTPQLEREPSLLRHFGQSGGNPAQHRRTSIPTDSAVRVRPPQPCSRSRGRAESVRGFFAGVLGQRAYLRPQSRMARIPFVARI